MAGVQYNIQVQSGNSKAELSAVIGLLQQSVAATNAVQSVMQQFGTSAVSSLNNIESAVQSLSDDFRSQLQPVVQQLPDELDNAAESGEKLTDSLSRAGQTAFNITNLRSAVSGLVDDLNQAVQPGIDLNTSLKEMQAITQLNDKQMDEFSQTARDNAKAFGVDAAKGLEGYQTYIASLGPEIAKSKPAIDELAKDANVLAKQMKGDVAGAAGLLTTAMQQFGVSMDDPIQGAKTATAMMNIMSAAAQEGSAELPDLKSGLEQAGMMAKTANVSFAETSAALEVLSNKGKKGAEGGVALRNAMSILSEGELLPPKTQEILTQAGVNIKGLADQSLTFAQRLELLKPIANDTAAMTALFGRENVSAGVALVNNTAAISEMTGKIVGSNSATEMANTIMGSYEERQNRITAKIKDFGISIFNAAQNYMPFINMGMGALSVMANLGQAMNLFSMLSQTKMVQGIMASVTGLGTWIASTITATAAQWGLNIAMDANPIGLVVIAVVAAIAAIAALVHWWDVITNAVWNFTKFIWNISPFGILIHTAEVIFPGFKAAMDNLWNWVKQKFEAVMGWAKKAWDYVKSIFTGGASGSIKLDAAVDVPKNITGITSAGMAAPASNFKYGTGKKGKKSKSVGSSTAKGISAGGSRPTTINLTIHKLQDQIVIRTMELKNGAKEAANEVLEELLTTLNSVNAKAAGIGG